MDLRRSIEQALVGAPVHPAEAGTLLTQGPIEEAVLDLLEGNVTRRVQMAVEVAS